MSDKAYNYQPAQLISIKANEDLPAKRFISPSGNLCQAGLIAIGVTEINWLKGNNTSIISLGTALVESVELIAVGDKVASATEGKAKKHVGTEEILGIALGAGKSGGLVKIKILC